MFIASEGQDGFLKWTEGIITAMLKSIIGYLGGGYEKYVSFAAGTEVFLFENSEESSLFQLESICSNLEESSCNSVKLYVELSETPWDLYDDYIARHRLSSKDIVVNFVRIEENFAYNNLLRNSIFKDAAEQVINASD